MSKKIYTDKYRKNIIASSDDLIVQINDNEIPVYPGVFYRMKTDGYLISWKRDEDDPFKVIGKTEDGDIYVSELTDNEMTDEEFDIYYARKGITEDTANALFSHVEDEDRNDLYCEHLRVY